MHVPLFVRPLSRVRVGTRSPASMEARNRNDSASREGASLLTFFSLVFSVLRTLHASEEKKTPARSNPLFSRLLSPARTREGREPAAVLFFLSLYLVTIRCNYASTSPRIEPFRGTSRIQILFEARIPLRTEEQTRDSLMMEERETRVIVQRHPLSFICANSPPRVTRDDVPLAPSREQRE